MTGKGAAVGKDVINYMAEGTQDAVSEIAQAVGEGLSRAHAGTTVHKACPKCHAENDPEASFCSSCGTALTEAKRCAACGHANDAAARFFDKCGEAFGGGG
jgi:membrane protease subunit (stomatin/prohibitin family)